MSHRLLPQFIIDRFAAGETNGTFNAASLFVDISGFTAASDAFMNYGPEGGERLADIMDETFAPLVASVYAYGGFVTGFAGDAFTALFPERGGQDQAVLRALAAVRRMRAPTTNRKTHDQAGGQFEIALKLGLATGLVEWGIIAPLVPNRELEPSVGYYFSGPAVQASGAAEELAQPGELVASYESWPIIADYCRAESLGDFVRILEIMDLPVASAPQMPPMPTEAQLVPFVPGSVRRQKNRGEFRDIITVFIDFEDRTASSAFSDFVQLVFSLQELYGGYLNTIHFGDKGSNLLLFWGMPTSFENDIERALQFIRHLARVAPGVFRAGITYRFMFAGFVGTIERQEYSCYGRGVNLAARLMMQASWGQVWLDDEAAHQAAASFQLRQIGHFSFKGFTQPQSAHLLLERHDSVPATTYQGNMIGRQPDLAQLSTFIAPLVDGRYAGMIVLWGEAGIGKSRLLHTLRQQLAADQRAQPAAMLGTQKAPKWVICPADEILRASLNPFYGWMRQYFEQQENVSQQKNLAAFNRSWEQLRHAVDNADLIEELARTRPFLARLLDLPESGDWIRQLDAKTRFDNTIATLLTLLLADSRRQPLVLVLEDANWLDDDSLFLVNRLIAKAETYPLAIIAAARPDARSWLAQIETDYSELSLGQLSADEIEQLSSEVLQAPTTPELVRLLVERSDGNPFFVEQTLLYLRERGLLQPGPDRHIGLADRPDLVVTMDLRALLVARLDRLTPDVKEVVQTAAVLGREFSMIALTEMLPNDPDLHSKVIAAESAAIWNASGNMRYIFRHTLFRDAAYSMQLLARRRLLHATAARRLKSLFATDLAPHYGELAYHLEKAELITEARHFLEAAAAAAAAAYQNPLALDYCQRLLATFANEILNDRADSLTYIRAHRIRAQVYQYLGDWPRMEAALLAALKQAAAPPLPEQVASIRSSMGELMRLKGHYEMALAFHQQALEFFQAMENDAEIARVTGYIGLVYAHLGNYGRALDCYKQARQYADRTGKKRASARMLNNIGTVHMNRGDLTAAVTDLRQSLAIYQALNDRQGVLMALGNLGNVQKSLGEVAAALDTLEAGLPEARQLGNKRTIALFLGNTGILHAELGNHEMALRYFEDALTYERELGNREGIARNLSNIGQLFLSRGEHGFALEYLERTVPLVRQLNARYTLAETLIRQASALLALDHPPQAQLSNDEGIQIAQSIGARRLAFLGQIQAARIQTALGQPGAEDRLIRLVNQREDIEEQALVYYELWQLTRARAHAQAALARFKLLEESGQLKDNLPRHRALLQALQAQA